MVTGCTVAGSLPAAGQVNVALVGDSITRGNHADGAIIGNNYPTHLQDLLDAAFGGGAYVIGDGSFHPFLNGFGHGGATLRNDGNRPYTDQTAYTESLGNAPGYTAPDIVVIMLGTNDARPGTNWDTSDNPGETAIFLQDYQSLISSYDALGSQPDIVVMSPIPSSTVVSGGSSAIDDDLINDVIAPAVRDSVSGFAEVDGFIDINALFPEDNAAFYDGDDRIHPSPLGYEFIAQQVFDLLAPAADLNLDHVVGVDDLDIVLSHWGQAVTPGDRSMGDANGDGTVDSLDLALVQDAWGQAALGFDGPDAVVPEPASGIAMLAGLSALSRRCRR